MAAVLVLSATLIARGISHGVSAPADFALHTTIAAQITTSASELSRQEREQILTGLRQAMAESNLRLGLSTTTPVSDRSGLSTSVRPAGTNIDFRTQLLPMTASAFDVLEVPLVRGRWHFDDPLAGEAVINETLAQQIWPDGTALGQRVTIDFDDRDVVIVGVTRDVHLRSLSEVAPLIHTPPLTSSMPTILAQEAPALEGRLRALVAGVRPDLSVRLTPLSASVMQTMEDALLGAGVAGGLGGIALILAIIGVFGVFSYVIEERRKEIGIRLALGARRREVRTAILRASRGAVLGGLAAGLVLSLIASFALRSYLFGLSPLDPASYGIVSMVLLGAGLLATLVPIRRPWRPIRRSRCGRSRRRAW